MARLIRKGCRRVWVRLLSSTIGPGPGAHRNENRGERASDGYTLQLANLGALVISPALYKNDRLRSSQKLHSGRDRWDQLICAGGTPTVRSTVPELIAYAKAHPGKLNHGAASQPSPHLLGELSRFEAARISSSSLQRRRTAITDLSRTDPTRF